MVWGWPFIMTGKEPMRECKNYKKAVPKEGRFRKFLFQDGPLVCLRNLKENISAMLNIQRSQLAVFSPINIELFPMGADAAFQGREDMLNSADPTMLAGGHCNGRMYNKCLFYGSL